ncbi:phosphonate C-P lyase system protein PhnH [Spirochaeta cellobiosiphila]|uniref:phosphonate C-P lyase system protein PhnH n=1 Tax=Spirochaeta cellobiosiphila TaxID=504483 RepID=UPI0003FAEE53|nr:phosphonate C-P lyase system protein PhnH [Spirochaeta cellobiosiphila]
MRTIDPVHHTQKVYRQLVKAFSFPGRIYTLGIDDKITTTKDDMVLLLGCTLLDQGVLVSLVGSYDDTFLHQLTHMKRTTKEKADFLFVLNQEIKEEASLCFTAAKKGSELNPHEGATILLSIEDLSLLAETLPTESHYQLSGPGIKDVVQWKPLPFLECWIPERNKACSYFPLGVDVLLFDQYGRLCGLPRTTTISYINKEVN